MTDKIRVNLTDEPGITGQDAENLKTCAQNLTVIGTALHAYEREHGNFPEWLSELHPAHLIDTNALICPADEDAGIPILPYDTDPNLPVSYSYDCTPEYYEQWLKEERTVYGDANPFVRCPHHTKPDKPDAAATFLYLNLSFSNTVYISEGDWRKQPIKVYGSLEAAIAGYEKALQLAPEEPNFFNLYPELVRLYVEAERDKEAENLIKRFKSIMKPDDEDIMRFRDYWPFVDMLKAVGRHADALHLLQNLEKTEQENPFIRSIFREIAMIHEEQGNAELADAYYLKADPKLAMIGKPVPDFSTVDLEDNPISIRDYRGKVVLLEFWAVWCGPCLGQMPNVKKVYDAYKDDGFDVIGVSFDNDVAELREYLEICNLPWRQIFDGPKGTLKKLYNIRGIPSAWLIDKDGTLISYQARGAELKKLVAEAVKKK